MIGTSGAVRVLIATKPVDFRLGADGLAALIREELLRDRPDGTTIVLPLRRKDLAEYSGTTLRAASRTIAAWEKGWLFVCTNGRFTISDLLGIRCVA